MCGRTTTLTKTPPLVFLVAPAGGVVLFPVTVGIGATGPCPPSFTTSISLTVSCLPPPGAAGVVVIPTPGPGPWPAAVPVAIPPGPPRICTVSGTATTTWADGVTTVGTGDTVFCIVEPSPGDPSIPRLDLERLSPPVQMAHPGDQRTHLYRLTNNDPVEGVTVDLTADSEQTSRMPTGSPLPPGSPNGYYAISDPGQGDNFPIAFIDELPADGCVPLPPDPPSFLVPVISRSITLAPGQSRVVGIAQRSWPMCGCGSACESRVSVSGLYTDGTPALACAGAGLFVDCNVPPDFAWPDSGANGPVHPAGPVLTTQILMPTHAIGAQIGAQTIMVAAQPLLVNTQTSQTDQFRSRITASGVAQGGPPLQVGQPVNVISLVDIVPMGGDSTWELQDIGIHLAAPGFNDSYVLLNARSKVQAPGIPATVDSFFDVFQIVSLDGISGGLSRKGRIMTDSILIQPVGPTTYSLGFTAVFDSVAGLPNLIEVVNLRMVDQAIATGLPTAAGPCASADHDCLTPGGPGCTDAACCNLVCALDASCCEKSWDATCVDQAQKTCGLGPACGDGICDDGETPFNCPKDCPFPPCLGDLNGDGEVGGADLGLLLSLWGTPNPLADLNGDGIVDGADLGLMLGNWGPCGIVGIGFAFDAENTSGPATLVHWLGSPGVPLHDDDVILAYQGVPVASGADLAALIESLPDLVEGQIVTLNVQPADGGPPILVAQEAEKKAPATTETTHENALCVKKTISDNGTPENPADDTVTCLCQAHAIHFCVRQVILKKDPISGKLLSMSITCIDSGGGSCSSSELKVK